MRPDFQSAYYTYDVNTKYQAFTKGCVSFIVVMTFGMYELYMIESFYNTPVQNKLIYYYLAINEQCNRGSGMNIYFQTFILMENHVFYYKFAEEKHHYIWYDYGVTSVLYFHIER